MVQLKRRMFPAIVAGAVGLVALSARAETPAASSAPAAGGDATAADLQAQIKALQAKVNSLEAQQSQNQADVNSAIQHVLEEADKHSRMMDVSGVNGGWDSTKGFYLQSDDGQSLFHPWLQFQVRNVTTWAEKAKADGNDNTDNGWEIRRMKFGFDGTLFTKRLSYLFQWATDRHTGTPTLEDAWVRYMFEGSPFGFRVGQFKDPFAHESLVSSKKLMAAERTYLTDRFTGGDNYVQGVTGIYDDGGALRGEVGFTDGIGSQNTNFQDQQFLPTSIAGPTNFGVAGRVEYKFFGNWKDYDQFTALGDKDDLLVAGGGVDWTQAGDTNLYLHTVDIQYDNPNGLGLYAAYIGRYRDTNNSTTSTGSNYDYGLEGQVSYIISGNWEPFARYDYIHIDSNSPFAGGSNTRNDIHEITAGVNYYFHGHAAKVTVDASYLPNGAPVSDDGAGILANNGNNEVVIRGQFQLLI